MMTKQEIKYELKEGDRLRVGDVVLTELNPFVTRMIISHIDEEFAYTRYVKREARFPVRYGKKTFKMLSKKTPDTNRYKVIRILKGK